VSRNTAAEKTCTSENGYKLLLHARVT
jgi:hypothetical protein